MSNFDLERFYSRVKCCKSKNDYLAMLYKDLLSLSIVCSRRTKVYIITCLPNKEISKGSSQERDYEPHRNILLGPLPANFLCSTWQDQLGQYMYHKVFHILTEGMLTFFEYLCVNFKLEYSCIIFIQCKASY